VCDLETSRIGVPYIYDISRLRVNCVVKCEENMFIRNLSDKYDIYWPYLYYNSRTVQTITVILLRFMISKLQQRLHGHKQFSILESAP